MLETWLCIYYDEPCMMPLMDCRVIAVLRSSICKADTTDAEQCVDTCWYMECMKHTMDTNQTQVIFEAALVAETTGISNSMHCNSGYHAIQQCLAQ
jgi:hypothetical protein